LLKRNPNDAQTRRLLGHIYLRTLGNPGEATGQSETVNRAVEQFKEVVRLDPNDVESALWLARLYRLQNQHEKAEEVSARHFEERCRERSRTRTVDAIVAGSGQIE
jgi:cytochrome c-type biogenesis protein CcmH/NrfG